MKRRDFIALVAASAGSTYLAERQARALKEGGKTGMVANSR